MPTEMPRFLRRLKPLAALLVALPAAQWVQAQTDDSTPFYVGGSLGVSRVSNVYRQANATNDDTVVSAGILGGVDQRYGRQHLVVDGSLQDNRYATNSILNNRSYSLNAALNWQTVGDLSGVLRAKSDRSLADFNIGSGVDPNSLDAHKKNNERNDEYQALARLGVGTRYSLDAGWLYRRRDFTAEEYNRFVFHQNTSSLGAYAKPGGNVRLGLAFRHTSGTFPRYPVGYAIEPTTPPRIVVVSSLNDFTRDDFDFTTNWETGGSSTLNTRLSRSRTRNELAVLRDPSGTTGSIAWNWRVTAKMQLNATYARDTGQETLTQAADVNRIYTSWQVGGSYALTAKVSLNAGGSISKARRTSDSDTPLTDAFDNDKAFNVGLRWALSRGASLGCQYNHASRDSSVAQYIYSANSYGCTGQLLLY